MCENEVVHILFTERMLLFDFYSVQGSNTSEGHRTGSFTVHTNEIFMAMLVVVHGPWPYHQDLNLDDKR